MPLKSTDMQREIQKQFKDLPPKSFLEIAAKTGIKILHGCHGKVSQDFEEFYSYIIGPKGFVNVKPNLTNEEGVLMREEILMLHRVGLWAQSGLNVFSLSDSLAAGFMLTEPPPLEEDKLYIPFPSFCIRIPPGYLPLFDNNKQGWAQMIWVHDYYGPESTTQSNAHFFRWMIMGSGVQLWRDRDGDHLISKADDDPLIHVWDDDPPEVPQDRITLEYGLRIIRNLVAWLDSMGGLSHQRQAPRPTKRRNKSKSSDELPHVWLIGHEVKLKNEVRKMASEIALGQTNQPVAGWRVRVRHIVRGHWRNQPYGTGRQLKKKLWIEPFWRGPEGAMAWSHLYTDK